MASKGVLFSLLFVFLIGFASASDYYHNITSDLRDDDLKSALQGLIYPHTELSYQDLWQAFKKLDENELGCGNGTLFDVYTGLCYKEGKQQCGNYKREGDCYNREHSWPKSWWGGFSEGHGAQVDLFHLFPVDGYVNGRRSNLPLGYVTGTPIFTSHNGAKIGKCKTDVALTCFEVSDDFKGDLARAYFYISVAYQNEFTCCVTDGVDKWHLKKWMEDDLRQWHKVDPVSDKEHERNDLIYSAYQHNRNPFIDHPEYVDRISDF
eukprot:GCRY01000132.1.p1 GENE.GCRY01000132.1~~GCRY01000132.1.p1  ORF type:complete len:303 (+),score=40.69 GCRY01000132.1:119-910(+)